MHTPDIEKAVLIYYSKPEIGNAEIKEIFGASGTKAQHMKKKVYEVMTERGVKVWMPHTVNTKIAFEVWGIDIKEFEERLRKIKSLERRNVYEAKTT